MKLRKEQTQNRGKKEGSRICVVVFSNVYYIFSTTNNSFNVIYQNKINLIIYLKFHSKLSNTFASS